MQLFPWTDSLALGIVEIDLQHKQLVGMVNDLHDAMLQGKANDVLGVMLRRLATYTDTHFATEERYFDRFGYDGAAVHKLQHRQFGDKVADFRRGFEEGRVLLSVDVMSFLKTWLVDHMSGIDQKYVQCFRSHGLK